MTDVSGLGLLDAVLPPTDMARYAFLVGAGLAVLGWRIKVAPPSPPPKAPARPWERHYGTATVLAVQGNMFGTLSYV